MELKPPQVTRSSCLTEETFFIKALRNFSWPVLGAYRFTSVKVTLLISHTTIRNMPWGSIICECNWNATKFLIATSTPFPLTAAFAEYMCGKDLWEHSGDLKDWKLVSCTQSTSPCSFLASSHSSLLLNRLLRPWTFMEIIFSPMVCHSRNEGHWSHLVVKKWNWHMDKEMCI